MDPTLIRTLRLGCTGKDVEGWTRGAHRYLRTGDLLAFERKPQPVRRTFLFGKQELAKKCAAKAGLPQYGVVGPALDEAMRSAGAYDAKARALFYEYENEQAGPKVVFPVPLGHNCSVCQALHPTAGLRGNWAIDFCCAPNTPLLAVEDAWISRLSGRSPNDDTYDSQGVFGWSTYYKTRDGYEYYLTHQGRRAAPLKVGLKVYAGDVIGWVGDQDYRPDHAHLGVSSPLGEADAKKRILLVSKAERVG